MRPEDVSPPWRHAGPCLLITLFGLAPVPGCWALGDSKLCAARPGFGLDPIDRIPPAHVGVAVDFPVITWQGGGTLTLDSGGPREAQLLTSPGKSQATLHWVPAANEQGPHQLTFRLVGDSGCATQTVTVDVVEDGQAVFTGELSKLVDVRANPDPIIEMHVAAQEKGEVIVDLTLDPPIDGVMLMRLPPPTSDDPSLSAVLSWQPRPEQIQARCRYHTTLVATNRLGHQSRHNLDILFIPPGTDGQPGCGHCPSRAAPTVMMPPVADQTTLGDFPVTASVQVDPASMQSIQAVYLFWTTGPVDPTREPLPQLENSLAMEGGSQDPWIGRIPRQAAPGRITYQVCAVAGAGPGDDCSQMACANNGVPMSFAFGVPPPLAAFCEACTQDQDCQSGLCHSATRTCGQPCSPDASASCPDGSSCDTSGPVATCAPLGGSCECLLSVTSCAGVVINEVFPRPGGLDLNFDGTADDVQDGYVELVNTSTLTAFDLTGWSLNGGAFVFPPGVVLPPRAVALVFGGGTSPCLGCYGSALGTAACSQCRADVLVFAGSGASGISLAAGAGSVLLADNQGHVVDSMTYRAEQVTPQQSLNRETDADPAAPFVAHGSAHGACPDGGAPPDPSACSLWSPGTRVDHSPFGMQP
jgi:hypothetical protein